MKRKYSKSSTTYSDLKRKFFEDNDSLLTQALQANKSYAEQPQRSLCKLCLVPLDRLDDFESHNVKYVFCATCGHLNGRNQDTSKFFAKLYLNENSIEYNSPGYIEGSFESRVSSVYSPKVDFLLDNLPNALNEISLLDVGCGAGHFVAAALSAGINAIGIDVSLTSVQYGNLNIWQKFQKEPLKVIDPESLVEEIVNSNSNVLSLIGVIEHIQNLEQFFDAVAGSKAQFIYYSVPMASLTVLLELNFNNVFPRQLSADHTHLFTESSLNFLNNRMNIEPISEWRFGTDILDLYRSLMVNTEKKHFSNTASNYFFENFKKCIDEMQSILDENHFCSEIHVIGRRKSGQQP